MNKHRLIRVGQTIDLETLGDARCLVLGGGANGLPAWDGTSTFNYLLRVQLTGHGLPYLREFALPSFRAVEIACAAYDMGKVTLTGVTLGAVGWNPVELVLSAGEANPAREEVVYLPVSYANAAERVVPNGARRFVSAVNSLSWAWRGNTPAATITVTDPLTAGVPVSVKGPRFVPAAGISGFWEIAL